MQPQSDTSLDGKKRGTHSFDNLDPYTHTDRHTRVCIPESNMEKCLPSFLGTRLPQLCCSRRAHQTEVAGSPPISKQLLIRVSNSVSVVFLNEASRGEEDRAVWSPHLLQVRASSLWKGRRADLLCCLLSAVVAPQIRGVLLKLSHTGEAVKVRSFPVPKGNGHCCCNNLRKRDNKPKSISECFPFLST